MKERAEIVVIGTVSDTNIVSGWTFDGKGRDILAYEVRDGKVIVCGWTADELRAIAESAESAP